MAGDRRPAGEDMLDKQKAYIPKWKRTQLLKISLISSEKTLKCRVRPILEKNCLSGNHSKTSLAD